MLQRKDLKTKYCKFSVVLWWNAFIIGPILVDMPRSHSGEGATMISANIEEQRRLQIRQNSPKKAGKCSHVIKDLHTSTNPLRCSTMPFECPETKQEYIKNTLRTGEDIWRIYPRISYK